MFAIFTVAQENAVVELLTADALHGGSSGEEVATIIAMRELEFFVVFGKWADKKIEGKLYKLIKMSKNFYA